MSALDSSTASTPASMTKPFVELKAIKKQFGNTETVHGVDLSINTGEFIVFVGPSGCGKSTLLRMIAGLESVTEGAILIDGVDVTNAPASTRRVAMVFQSYALYPHMTVAENLTFGMRMRGVAKATISNKTTMAVDLLRLAPYMQRKPGELSGGQAQRVAIGRALVQDPALFLFDEPLSNLDAELRLSMRIELAALHKQLGKTMIYVTHDQVEAMTLADRIVVLRDGHIEQIGKPLELYKNPANMFVAGFIGSPAMNFLPATIKNDATLSFADGTSFPHTLNVQKNSSPSCRIGIRPEHLRIATNGALKCTVKAVEQLGASGYVYAEWCGQTLCAQLHEGDSVLVGGMVRFETNGAHWLLFNVDGQRV